LNAVKAPFYFSIIFQFCLATVLSWYVHFFFFFLSLSSLFFSFFFSLFFYALARSECFSGTAMNISGKYDKCDEMRAKLRKTFHIPAALLLTVFFQNVR